MDRRSSPKADRRLEAGDRSRGAKAKSKVEGSDEKLVQAKTGPCALQHPHPQIEFSRTMQHSYAPWVPPGLPGLALPSLPLLQLRNKHFLIESEFWGHLMGQVCSPSPCPCRCSFLGCCHRIDVVVACFEVAVVVAIVQWLTYKSRRRPSFSKLPVNLFSLLTLKIILKMYFLDLLKVLIETIYTIPYYTTLYYTLSCF